MPRALPRHVLLQVRCPLELVEEALTKGPEMQPAELIATWRRIASAGEAEIATSPFAHPIMPLLIDTGIVTAGTSVVRKSCRKM